MHLQRDLLLIQSLKQNPIQACLRCTSYAFPHANNTDGHDADCMLISCTECQTKGKSLLLVCRTGIGNDECTICIWEQFLKVQTSKIHCLAKPKMQFGTQWLGGSPAAGQTLQRHRPVNCLHESLTRCRWSGGSKRPVVISAVCATNPLSTLHSS